MVIITIIMRMTKERKSKKGNAEWSKEGKNVKERLRVRIQGYFGRNTEKCGEAKWRK